MRNEREGMLRCSPDACACTLVAHCRSPAVRPLSRRRATKLLHSVAWGQRQVLQFAACSTMMMGLTAVGLPLAGKPQGHRHDGDHEMWREEKLALAPAAAAADQLSL